ncbi:endonuclease/exonuclease/phosphatase family protein [Devosia aquimaris]|uniref:endonuclease/exonuclease/phosphatase family protein n=1 Tax=Devosia aquimaris TaxID=2866214 RepID=UPI001CD08409|nr:endonuclease/exonuclease/phosphatase family protein [Devosia sp. CJK-A8-3]
MSLDAVKPAQPTPLAVPSLDEREALRGLERTLDNHLTAMAGLACLQRVEAPPMAQREPLAFPLTVAAWNLERCYAVAPSAALLAEQDVDIVLLSEVDNGMARTGQRHTAAEIAAGLTMGHAYGVEFLELDLGAANELAYCVDDFNSRGFHGNALLSSTNLLTPVLTRLPDQLFWFNNEVETARVGTRCAIAATLMTQQGPLFAVSVHLESRGDGAHRGRQMAMLFDTVAQLAGDMPVVIGGDLNTGLADGGDFDAEPLFADAAARGYVRHSGRMDQMTTRPSRLSRGAKGAYKLDWLLTRGLEVTESRIIAAVAPDGEVLSDHDMVVARIAGFTAR